MKKNLTIIDTFLIILFLAVFGVILYFQFFLNQKGNIRLLVEAEDNTYYYSLSQKKIITIKGIKGLTEIEIDNYKFRFLSSACPNKNCIHTGWVELLNFPVICLPNEVSARIVSDKIENEYDEITR